MAAVVGAIQHATAAVPLVRLNSTVQQSVEKSETEQVDSWLAGAAAAGVLDWSSHTAYGFKFPLCASCWDLKVHLVLLFCLLTKGERQVYASERAANVTQNWSSLCDFWILG